jgi:DNA adenine methylase
MQVNGTSNGSLPQPFLRWAGGKQRLASTLAAHLPSDLDQLLYVEPFLGGGSLFFRVQPKKAVLADLNPDLIQAYRQLRANAELVSRYLVTHERSDCEEYYYAIRHRYNSSAWTSAQSARFIYLNRTCFNGIYRVNERGAFNVPYGHKANPVFPTASQLNSVGRLLSSATLRCQCFRKTLAETPRDAFVYIDPPYPPLNGTAYFTHYTADRFSQKDQEALASLAFKLDRRGIRFLMSNADIPLTRTLYRRFRCLPLNVTRYITCRSEKHKVAELVIRNY